MVKEECRGFVTRIVFVIIIISLAVIGFGLYLRAKVKSNDTYCGLSKQFAEKLKYEGFNIKTNKDLLHYAESIKTFYEECPDSGATEEDIMVVNKLIEILMDK